MAKQKETKTYSEMIDFVAEVINERSPEQDERADFCEILAFAYGKELHSVKASIQVKMLQLECLKRLKPKVVYGVHSIHSLDGKLQNEEVKGLTVTFHPGNTFEDYYENVVKPKRPLEWIASTPVEELPKEVTVRGGGSGFPVIPRESFCKDCGVHHAHCHCGMPDMTKGLGESSEFKGNPTPPRYFGDTTFKICQVCGGSGKGAFTFGCVPGSRSIQQPCWNCNGRKTVLNKG